MACFGNVVRVICAGHVNWDVTLCVDRLPEPDGEATITKQYQSGGGSASNVATGLTTLGIDTALLGSVGSDKNGHLVRRTLVNVGVDCTGLVTTDGDTAVKYLVVDADGEVAVLGNKGANEAFSPEDLPDGALPAADHLHLTSQRPETATRLAERAKKAGARVSFDPGRRIADREYSSTLEYADVLFLNEHEASTALDRQLVDIDDLDRVLVIKHGAAGAEVLTPDGRYASHEGFDITAVDTTGAGDAFAAGFIAVMLDTNADDNDNANASASAEPEYEYALAVGNACGALAAREPGAQVRLDWDAISAILH